MSIVPVGGQGVYAMDVVGTERLWKYYHEAYCVTVVRDGLAYCRYRNQELECSPDRVLIFEPGEAHVNTRNEAPGSFFALTLSPEQLTGLTADGTGDAPQIKRSELVSTHAFKLMLDVIRASRFDEPAAQQERMCIALGYILEHSAETAEALPAGARSRVRQGAELLKERYYAAPARTVDIQTVAAELGMSYYWFVHSFGDEYGMPPYRYVQTLRCAHARSLMRRGPNHGLRSVRDIALAAGYSDGPHMSRDFKRSFGVSPSVMARGIHAGWGRTRSPESERRTDD